MPVRELVKKRISEYLHGHVQSKLLVLQYRLGQCQELVETDPHGAAIFLEEIKTGLRSVQEEYIRRASHDLYPSIVKLGLGPALRSLAERFRNAVPIELSVDDKIWSSWPEEFRVGVYRIVEEALDNVVKHASARTVQVSLQCSEDGTITLDIYDDGRGFEVGNAGLPLGLWAIEDYVQATGGRLAVNSVPGKGTRVWVITAVPEAQ